MHFFLVVYAVRVGLAHENLTPVLDFKERFQQLRWIGHGCDSDVQLTTLYEYWLVNHSNELFDPSTGPSAIIPPPRMHVYFDFITVIILWKQTLRFLCFMLSMHWLYWLHIKTSILSAKVLLIAPLNCSNQVNLYKETYKKIVLLCLTGNANGSCLLKIYYLIFEQLMTEMHAAAVICLFWERYMSLRESWVFMLSASESCYCVGNINKDLWWIADLLVSGALYI